MAIIQISKLQQRSGNLVDLPQLDDAEFGWATDSGQLYIGKGSPAENIEVLTSYSNISFSQITGSGGNISVTAAEDGQILSFDGTNWVNKGGIAGGLLDLGQVGNVKLGGGAIGYVLETDGLGSLSWTSKGTIRVNILALDNGNPIAMTVDPTTPYVNDMQVTISGVQSVTGDPAIVNGQSFFIQVAPDFPTTGNVSLYYNQEAVGPVDGLGLDATANTGIAVTSLVSGGAATAQGFDTSIQYNQGSILQGSADLTFDYNTNLFTVNGNANVGNLSSYRLFSNVVTGTTPIVVTSTTRVANLNVSYANVSDFSVTTAQTTGTFYPTFVSGNTTANFALGSNANLSFNAATSTLSVTLMTGTLTTAAQPNITSVGSLTGLTVVGTSTTGILSVTGNANVGNLGTSGLVIATGNVTGGNLVTAGRLSVTGNANVGNLGTLGLIIATGNISGANFNGTFYGAATGLTAIPGANVTGTVANATYAGTANAVAGANVSGAVSFATTANAVAGANVSGQVANALVAGTVYTNAQPNITSVGTLSSLTTTIISSGATATVGTITGNWTLAAGSKLNATYADLAECYEADAEYEPGTVLMFGGDKEVTLASDATNKVAGVVSTNPAYTMNSLCPGVYVSAIALQGRAPCRVRGSIHKGDMLIAGGDGFARPSASPLMGTVIGKSLEDFNGVSGIIECAVGRL